MSLKILVLNTDYPDYLKSLYSQHPGLENQPYEEQIQVRRQGLFGDANFYSSNLCKLGHEAHDIYLNNQFMQRAWAKEKGIKGYTNSVVRKHSRNILQLGLTAAGKTPLRHLRRVVRRASRAIGRQDSWVYDILASQIKYFRPDVVYNQAMDGISSSFLREMKPNIRLLIGQHAATKLPDTEDWGCYDLAISSFPPTVDWFRQKGLKAEMVRLAFEPAILSQTTQTGPAYDLTFIGSFFKVHSSRTQLLEEMCNRFKELKIWGPTLEQVAESSPIRDHYNGPAWGLDMFQILQQSRITLNHHGNVPPFANNMRLFEATGMGALLVTDWKENLKEMFEPGKEVLAYRNDEECTELVRYYLAHEKEGETIAQAGQRRTLSDHTYLKRMQELDNIVKKYLY